MKSLVTDSPDISYSCKLLLSCILSVSLALFANEVTAATRKCGDVSKGTTGENLLNPSVMTTRIEGELKAKGMTGRELRGYSILIGTMVASAAATTYVTAALPGEFQFLSQLLAQISTLGVYVFGAPIWEPLSSGFRKLAFGIRSSERRESSDTASEFESLWRRTQENYSLNAQMSRNVINQFLISVHHNFYEAYRAVRSDRVYAADQIAEAAFRLRTLFRDVEPEDVSLAAAVRTAFTNHITVDKTLEDLVQQRLQMLDQMYGEPAVKEYYSRLLQAWLGK